METLPPPEPPSVPPEPEVEAVASSMLARDPAGTLMARVLRETLDQLYDGQRTGRYRWDQLYKTEKTHCGTLVEINLQRAFHFEDGAVLDYTIAGVEVDCKFSQTLGGWMIPPEARDHVCLLVWAEDLTARWSAGLLRVTADRLNTGGNRDSKATLNGRGRAAIRWLFKETPLPPNVLLQLPRAVVDGIMALRSGQQRVNAIFREAPGRIVGRGVIATLAQQDDYMKRLRENGGARTTLRKEGMIILGQYHAHVRIARALGVPEPGEGDSVAVRVAPSEQSGPGTVEIDGSLWRTAAAEDPVTPALMLPKV